MGLGIGAGEIILVLIVALIIWGPNRLPEIMRTVGKAVRTLRKASFDFTSVVTRELEEDERRSHVPPAQGSPAARKEPETPPAAVNAPEKKQADNGEGGQPESGEGPGK